MKNDAATVFAAADGLANDEVSSLFADPTECS